MNQHRIRVIFKKYENSAKIDRLEIAIEKTNRLKDKGNQLIEQLIDKGDDLDELEENSNTLKSKAEEFSYLSKKLKEEAKKAAGWSFKKKISVGGGLCVGGYGLYRYLLF